MKLIDYMNRALIIPELAGQTKAEVVAELARHLCRSQPDWDAEALIQAIVAREDRESTALDIECAFPHCRFAQAERLFLCVGRSTRGVLFGAHNGMPAHLFFLLVAPESMTETHVKALARISRMCRDSRFRARLLSASDAAEMLRIVEEEEAEHEKIG